MNIQFCTVNGLSDTHIHSDQPYQTITLAEVEAMVREPVSVDKVKAQWAIFSNYHQFDARKHHAQRERSSFVVLPIDLNEGAPRAGLMAAPTKLRANHRMLSEPSMRAVLHILPVRCVLIGENYMGDV
jgi:hypothetical protein